MQAAKQSIKDSIRKSERFAERLATLEAEKKAAVAALHKPTTGDGSLALVSAADDKEAKRAITERFAAETERLRYRLEEMYEERRRTELSDYNIFMAVAEDIGYDATGRKTKVNELEAIAVELREFIVAVDEGDA